MQVFVKNLQGNSTAYAIDSSFTSSDVKSLIEAREGIPSCSQGLVYAGKQLQDEACVSSYGVSAGSTMHLVLRLRGGKGGFGALLRGQGRDGKVTSNFDAMRDLQGRRIRHSKCEEKLEEWREKQHERDLEKIAQRHITELLREQRKEAREKVDLEQVAAAQSKAIQSVTNAVQDALAEAHASAAACKRKTAAEEGDNVAKKPATKRSKMLACLEEFEDSGDDSDE